MVLPRLVKGPSVMSCHVCMRAELEASNMHIIRAYPHATQCDITLDGDVQRLAHVFPCY